MLEKDFKQEPRYIMLGNALIEMFYKQDLEEKKIIYMLTKLIYSYICTESETMDDRIDAVNVVSLNLIKMVQEAPMKEDLI